VVYTDDDCVCDREWLASIYAEFAADPTVLGVYGRVIPYGKHDGMICPCINESTERLVLEGPAIPHLKPGGGNNMSFRKSVFRKAACFLNRWDRERTSTMLKIPSSASGCCGNRCKIVYSPVPVVQHDKWLDGPGLAELNKGAVRGLGLVFLAYALRFDRVRLRSTV